MPPREIAYGPQVKRHPLTIPPDRSLNLNLVLVTDRLTPIVSTVITAPLTPNSAVGTLPTHPARPPYAPNVNLQCGEFFTLAMRLRRVAFGFGGGGWGVVVGGAQFSAVILKSLYIGNLKIPTR